MKNLILPFLFLVPALALGQVTLYNTSLTDSTIPLVYMGARNYIRVTGLENSSQPRLESHHGTITQDNYRKHVYVYFSEDWQQKDTLYVYDGGQPVDTLIWQQKNLEIPLFKVAHSLDTVMPLKDLLADPVIEFYNPGLYKLPDHNVLHFNAELLLKNGKTFNLDRAEGNRFSEDQLAFMLSLRPGDRLRISKVKVYCEGCIMPLILRQVTIRIE